MAETPLDYETALDCLTGLCRGINLLPLEHMQDQIAQMEAIGPVLEPTAYRDGGSRNPADQRRIIDAARALQVVCEEIRDHAQGDGRG